MFYTYISTNRQRGTLYTGHTDDLSLRMEQHCQKTFKGFTAKYGCDKLVWYEIHNTRDAAFRCERQIKKWKRAWKLNLVEVGNPHWLDIHTERIWPPLDRYRPSQV